jgi:hypothetical protein
MAVLLRVQCLLHLLVADSGRNGIEVVMKARPVQSNLQYPEELT